MRLLLGLLLVALAVVACGEDEVPAWLVFSAQILAARTGAGDPGEHPEATWLEEEGFDPSVRIGIVESFARYFMMTFHTWSDEGFDPVADSYLARLPRDPDDGRRGIDHDGSLLVHRAGGIDRTPLGPAIREPEWLDPLTGMPRL